MSVDIGIFYSLISESEWITFCVFASAISLACAIWNNCFFGLLKRIDDNITEGVIRELKKIVEQIVRKKGSSEECLNNLYDASRRYIEEKYRAFVNNEQEMFKRFYDPSALVSSIVIAFLILFGRLEQLGAYNMVIILFPYALTAIVFTCDCMIFIRTTTTETTTFLHSRVAEQKQQLHKEKRIITIP